MCYNVYRQQGGEILKQLRKKSGLKRREVAEILGIQISTLNRVENGICGMPKLRAEKLAELYKCSPKVILDKWRVQRNEYNKCKYERSNKRN